MENSQPQNRSCKPAHVVLTFALGLVATIHTGIAQPPEVPPAPSLELVLGSDSEWVAPELLLVSFALRNTGRDPVVVAQRPGIFLSMLCITQSGGIAGGAFGGVACSQGEAFVELKPGQALLGKEVVKIPEECARSIEVTGNFQTFAAESWDVAPHDVTIGSKPLVIDKH
jgi:hypothetical protein